MLGQYSSYGSSPGRVGSLEMVQVDLFMGGLIRGTCSVAAHLDKPGSVEIVWADLVFWGHTR